MRWRGKFAVNSVDRGLAVRQQLTQSLRRHCRAANENTAAQITMLLLQNRTPVRLEDR